VGRRSRLRLHAIAFGLLAGLGVAAPAVASAQAPEGPPVDSLVVEGNHRVSTDQIVQSSGIVLFQPVNYRSIQRAIQSLFNTGNFDDVQVEQRGGEEKLIIAIIQPNRLEEVKAALESGKPVLSYPEVLNGLTQSTTNYVVVGSFGKSTCSSLAAWVLLHAGKDPSFMIGALSPSLRENARLGSGGVFVLEGDEYPSANWDDTSKFIYFNTNHLLLTSCEHDHVNVFPTLADYLKPFRQLVAQPSIKTITACVDGAHVADVLADAKASITTYSQHDLNADYYAGEICRTGTMAEFDRIVTPGP